MISEANAIYPYGPQEVFDYVVDKLRKQGKLSIGASGFCRYRGLDGARCAIGWLTPDSMMCEMVHEQTVFDDFSQEAKDWFTDTYGVDVYFLNNLQQMHDRLSRTKVLGKQTRIISWDSDGPQTFDESFQLFAGQNGLNYRSVTP